ncbi:MAG: YfcC family protein [Anaerovoracaceae bacterium]
MTNLNEKKKKKISFPTAFTVLFIVLAIACAMTYMIPAGSYAKLQYDAGETGATEFTMTTPDGETKILPGTQETLDELGIKTDIEKFTDKSIMKPIGIPGTYEKVEAKHQGIGEFIQAPISGVYNVVDIMLFILVIGGIVGVLDHSGAFSAGINALSRATKGKEYILIVFVTFLIALGGTTFGLAEETIALYPILIPVFLAAKYDALVCIAAIYMGSSIGTMFSTVNPFSVVIASNAAGINFMEGMAFRLSGLVLGTAITIVYILRYANKVRKDQTKSYIYEDKAKIEARFSSEGEAPALTLSYKIALLLFLLTFVVMVWGVAKQGWWFGEMTALFLVSAVIIGVFLRIPEKEFVSKFIGGAGELVGVALVCGIARGVNVILENGKISDTILFNLSSAVEGMNPSIFIVLMMFVFVILGFFINSSSGLAVLSIPIIAPLADAVGLPRDVIISAYIFGLGMISFITPTGLILATLDLVDVTYDKWLKFVMPLMGILTVFSIIILLIQANISM